MKNIFVRLVIAVLMGILAYLSFMMLQDGLLKPFINSIVESQMTNTNYSTIGINVYQIIFIILKIFIYGGIAFYGLKPVYKLLKEKEIF